MPLQLYRYAACGGINVFWDMFTFFVCYNLIFKGTTFQMVGFIIKPHTAAYLLSFCFTFPLGFFLSKNLVWIESNLPGKVQLFRYFLMVLSNVFINIICLKLFIEVFNFNAVVAKIFTTSIVICFSYTNQKYFTFKVREPIHK